MLSRARICVDISNPRRPCLARIADDTSTKPKVPIIALVDTEKEMLHYEVGFGRHNPYRGSYRTGKALDPRSHEPVALTDEIQSFLRALIGALANTYVRHKKPFIVNTHKGASVRYLTNRKTKTIEAKDSRGWVVPLFLCLTVDPADRPLMEFFTAETQLNEKHQKNLRWFIKMVNYHTDGYRTLRGKGFREILKILQTRQEFLDTASLKIILPQLAKKDLLLELLTRGQLITPRQLEELSGNVAEKHVKSGFHHLNMAVRGRKKITGCMSFKVYGGNRIPTPRFAREKEGVR